jgi:hypothetical protein
MQVTIWHSRKQESPLVVHVVAISPGASTSGPARAAPALFPVVVAGPALSSGRRAHKGKVDSDLLLEQLFAVGAVDGGFGFVEGGVFDENVALQHISQCRMQARDSVRKRTLT